MMPDFEKGESNRWLTVIVIDSAKFGCDRESVRLKLESENIESRPMWKPMHQQPIFKKYPAYLNGVSDDLFQRGLCLPSGSNLTKDDKERIESKLTSILA